MAVVEDNTKEQFRSETQDGYYRLLNDPNEFEKMRFTDSINVYNSVIEEFQKLYEQTPTSDQFIRARCLKAIKRALKIGFGQI